MSANLEKRLRKSLGNEALEQRIAELEARVAELEEKLRPSSAITPEAEAANHISLLKQTMVKTFPELKKRKARAKTYGSE